MVDGTEENPVLGRGTGVTLEKEGGGEVVIGVCALVD